MTETQRHRRVGGRALWLLGLLALDCTIDRRLHAPTELAGVKPADSPYLKAHYKNGDVVVLSEWTLDAVAGVLHGQGERQNMWRERVAVGRLDVRISDVALFESNRRVVNAGVVAALTVVTLASAAVSVVCLTNPKACFGSCPTFYAPDGEKEYLAAEGFSESVAPALEATDVDALWRAKWTGRRVRLRVKNEALETHVIRRAALLAAPRPRGGRVVQTTRGRFLEAVDLRAPTACRAPEGDCLAAVRSSDDVERSSVTDGHDLATRETLELTFAAGPAAAGERSGIVIEARQGFITTYLFYQALAYMGRNAGRYLATLERGDEGLHAHAHALHHLLGGIEVAVRDGRGNWIVAGTYAETGPLARDVQVFALPEGTSSERVRLTMARGHFRVGRVALARLGAEVTPVPVPIARIVTHTGDAELAQRWLAGTSPQLVTLPGDEHVLEYDLPAEAEGLELFLESRGYYLEWMRHEWLAEESDLHLANLFVRPASMLRDLAPAYKQVEPRIEAMFWGSRYGR